MITCALSSLATSHAIQRGRPTSLRGGMSRGVGRVSAKVLPALVAEIRQGTEWKDKAIVHPRMETTYCM